MNKLAINSFLAVTAMAWLGQPLPAGARTANTATPTASEVFFDERGSVLRHYRYSPRERLLLNAFRQEQEARVSPVRPLRVGQGNGLPPGAGQDWHPGMVLRYDQMREARMLPAGVRADLDLHADQVLDLFVQGRLVRVLRETREIVDILDA